MRSEMKEARTRRSFKQVRARRLRPALDIGIAARFIVETCALWAVHRHWDAPRQDLPEERVRAAVIDLVVAALIEPAKSSPPTRTKGTEK